MNTPCPRRGEIVKMERGKAVWYMRFSGDQWGRCKKPKEWNESKRRRKIR